MRFADGEFVAFDVREFGREAEEFLDPDGEVGAVEQAATAAFGDSFQLWQLRIPASGADHDAATEREDGADIFDGGLGCGEVDDDIDTGEAGRGEGRGVLVFVDVERTHAVTALAGDFSDERAGFSFAENEYEHRHSGEVNSTSSLQLAGRGIELIALSVLRIHEQIFLDWGLRRPGFLVESLSIITDFPRGASNDSACTGVFGLELPGAEDFYGA